MGAPILEHKIVDSILEPPNRDTIWYQVAHS